MAACTRWRISAFTLASPLKTRDTVMGETPMCFATSCMVTALRRRLGVLFIFTAYLSPGLKLHCSNCGRRGVRYIIRIMQPCTRPCGAMRAAPGGLLVLVALSRHRVVHDKTNRDSRLLLDSGRRRRPARRSTLPARLSSAGGDRRRLRLQGHGLVALGHRANPAQLQLSADEAIAG